MQGKNFFLNWNEKEIKNIVKFKSLFKKNILAIKQYLTIWNKFNLLILRDIL